MGILGKIFTWWDGATIGTMLWSARNGEHVGTDAQGNKYFRGKKNHPDGRERRWVMYEGANDASRVPAEWHGWLHGSYDGVPESHLPPPRTRTISQPLLPDLFFLRTRCFAASASSALLASE